MNNFAELGHHTIAFCGVQNHFLYFQVLCNKKIFSVKPKKYLSFISTEVSNKFDWDRKSRFYQFGFNDRRRTFSEVTHLPVSRLVIDMTGPFYCTLLSFINFTDFWRLVFNLLYLIFTILQIEGRYWDMFLYQKLFEPLAIYDSFSRRISSELIQSRKWNIFVYTPSDFFGGGQPKIKAILMKSNLLLTRLSPRNYSDKRPMPVNFAFERTTGIPCTCINSCSRMTCTYHSVRDCLNTTIN